MTEFGEQLRKFRHRCNGSTSPHGKLTQEKFGELVGAEFGINYTGAAVSDWERGKSKIHDRPVLLAMVKVLYEYGGVRTTAEANQLLKAGNYRNLDAGEAERIFNSAMRDTIAEQIDLEQKIPKSLALSLFGNLFSIREDELQKLIANAEEGPSPSWPRVAVAAFRRFSDRLSVLKVLQFSLWIWVGLLAWALISPSLRWPFVSWDKALAAVVLYVAGSILVPALIGTLTKTSDNKFWREHPEVSTLNLRLYTHQGASIGFHVGYFFVFMIALLRYNLGWQAATWVELVAAAFLVALGYTSARLIPYNLFAAYDQFSLKDGGVFFIFFLVGPAWGYFFLRIHEILLTKSLGIFIVLLSMTFLLVMMTLRYRQSGTTVVPVYWWVIFWGLILLCQFLLLSLQ